MTRHPPKSTLFPSTTLSRSVTRGQPETRARNPPPPAPPPQQRPQALPPPTPISQPARTPAQTLEDHTAVVITNMARDFADCIKAAAVACHLGRTELKAMGIHVAIGDQTVDISTIAKTLYIDGHGRKNR